MRPEPPKNNPQGDRERLRERGNKEKSQSINPRHAVAERYNDMSSIKLTIPSYKAQGPPGRRWPSSIVPRLALLNLPDPAILRRRHLYNNYAVITIVPY